MALYKNEWWKKLVGKKEPKEKVDVLKDLEAIEEFLQGIDADTKNLLPLLEQLEELEKERQVGSNSIEQVNLDAQAELLEKLLEKYEFFQNDADINGLRVKALAQDFLRKAERAGLKDLVREKKNNPRWQFLW